MDKGKDESPTKRARLSCSYGEKCCRKTVAHFRDYDHPHLDRLLELADNNISIPSDYKLQISKSTLLQQLSTQRDLKAGVSDVPPNFPSCHSSQREKDGHLINTLTGSVCTYGESCFRKNEDHLIKFNHPHLDKLIYEMGDSTEFSHNFEFKVSKATLLKQIEVIKNYRARQASGSEEVETPIETPDSNPSQEEESIKRFTKTLMEAKNYYDEVANQSADNIAEKLAMSEPYNFFLTTVAGSPNFPVSIDDPLSVSFPDLLSPAMGRLVNSLQLNCLVEIGWLFAQYRVARQQGPPLPLTLIYSQCDLDNIDSMSHFLTYAKVKTPNAFGTHHTKMMVFQYADRSIRIVVSTANLIESDWYNKTQGLWISPRCPQLPETSTATDGNSCTNFKRDILRYFSAYNLPELHYWIDYLSTIDMSSIKVFFVASVPGTYIDDRDNWGLCALSKVIKDHTDIEDDSQWPVYMQCSSIGSLGKSFETSLLVQLRDAFCPGGSTPPVHFVFPSVNDVKRSYEGILGGGCVPYSKTCHDKQLWLNNYLCNWISNSRHRSRAVPHIKSYARASPDNKKLRFFVLTSANVSKAAWGSLTNNKTKLFIRSYEAGVVFTPKLMIQQNFFPLQKEENFAFPFPYDLPVTRYTAAEHPWFIELLESELRNA